MVKQWQYYTFSLGHYLDSKVKPPRHDRREARLRLRVETDKWRKYIHPSRVRTVTDELTGESYMVNI